MLTAHLALLYHISSLVVVTSIFIFLCNGSVFCFVHNLMCCCAQKLLLLHNHMSWFDRITFYNIHQPGLLASERYIPLCLASCWCILNRRTCYDYELSRTNFCGDGHEIRAIYSRVVFSRASISVRSARRCLVLCIVLQVVLSAYVRCIFSLDDLIPTVLLIMIM